VTVPGGARLPALQGASTIRPFAYLLLALLLALAAGTALYAGMVGLRTRVPDHPFEAVTPVATGQLPRPERLPASPEFARTAVEASQASGERRPEFLAVELVVTGASLLGSEAGLASFLLHDGSDFRWTPLDRCERTADGFLLRVPVIAAGDRVVVLAQTERFAQHAHLARTTIPAQQIGTATPARLQVALAEVELQLPANVASAGPLQLRRSDDPRWLPMHDASSGVFLRRGTITKVLLGAGRYELGAPLSATAPLAFDVPATGPITIPSELAAVRAGRP
jgi:hypothetical protein